MHHRAGIRVWLLATLLLVQPACDRTVTDPSLSDEDVDALLVRAGLTPAGDFTLPTLLHDAIRTVQQERGTEAARLQLERVRAAGALRDSADFRQLAVVLEVLGPGILEQAARETEARLGRLAASIDSIGDAEAVALRGTHARAVDALAQARAAGGEGDTLAALERLTRAAGLASDLRRDLLLRNRIEALPELFQRARARIDSTAGDQAGQILRHHGELLEAARGSVAHGKRLDTHQALRAVRAEELRLTVAALGEQSAASLVTEVTLALERLEPLAAGKPRTQRMHGAAKDLAVRARRELDDGRPETALDLASHAAGLANALLLAVTPR